MGMLHIRGSLTGSWISLPEGRISHTQRVYFPEGCCACGSPFPYERFEYFPKQTEMPAKTLSYIFVDRFLWGLYNEFNRG